METLNIDLQQFKNSNLNNLPASHYNTVEDIKSTTVNEAAVQGSVSCQNVSKQIYLFNLELSASGEHDIILSKGKRQPLSFIYCHSGEADIVFSENSKSQRLSKFQTAIISGQGDEDVTLEITSKESCKLTMIMIDREFSDLEGDTSDVIQSLTYLITDGDNDARINNICSRNLRISIALEDLNNLEEEGIVRKLIMAGKIRMILAMEYQQLLDDMNSVNKGGCSLTQTEMQKIYEATKLIKSELDRDFTVTSLSREVLLSVVKLQEGFKSMHGRTVTDYIRNVRLEEAERLLKTTDYNISEVVYTVGFLSRSYFSKIFKMKYNCNPSDYKNEFRSQVA
ncbi:helix-turn-helix domain-containing protein [Changchengzhania lutea]|uniref:helix-turn-helix domain-containing protein n=1 Tax=Changchengzhania lutea TaxID=2049305 RepID=UPI00115F7583|nr:AraC family transcriptional regulator [Changchengzhania lutea]